MRSLFNSLDDLLRGRLTTREELAAGRVQVPVGTLVFLGMLLGGAYGICMGLFSVFRGAEDVFWRVLATTLKVPLLFVLTLAVTYPSLYVVSAMFDSKLRHRETLRLLLCAMAVNLALLASFGPVTAFFTASTESYPFMMILNIIFFAVGGFAGLAFLDRALKSVFDDPDNRRFQAVDPRRAPAGDYEDEECEDEVDSPFQHRDIPGRARAQKPPPSRRVFRFWILIYGVVGAQMGWVLRPFVGAPALPFEWFRNERDSNFFSALGKTLETLLGG